MLGRCTWHDWQAGRRSRCLAPQFIAQYAPAVGAEDVGIFVSQSGETKDVLNAIEAARQRGMGVQGLVNVVGSTLTQVSEYYLPLGCGYEISVPATKTFTNQCIAFLYLAMRLGGKHTRTLANLPGADRADPGRHVRTTETIASSLAGWDDLYCLGFGLTYPIALEGALKLKEITYAHCEGMLSTEFKHGPLSAVSDQYPVLYVAGPEDVSLIISAINEVTCRGGHAIAIGQHDTRLVANAHQVITIPDAPPDWNALLAILPLQLLSYHLVSTRLRSRFSTQSQ